MTRRFTTLEGGCEASSSVWLRVSPLSYPLFFFFFFFFSFVLLFSLC